MTIPKTDPQSILVFPCGSEIGLEIHRALSWSTHFQLVGASSDPSNHGRYVYERYVEGLPFVDDENFIDEIQQTVRDQKIDAIMPAHDSVVLKLAEHASAINCRIAAPPVDTCRVCRSKRTTYRKFRNLLRVPEVFDSERLPAAFPVFLKPDVGQGSKGVQMANTPDELLFLQLRNPKLLALEYLPGNEFTVDCFTDRHRELRFVGGRARTRIMNGISVDTQPVPDARFQQMARVINETLTLRGAWFFQVKETKDGELALLEIGPRIAGAMGLYRNLGVNFALLTLYDCFDLDVNLVVNDSALRMDRALASRFQSNLNYEHLYIDLDDTVIHHDCVNPMAMALVFQCRNRGIKVHLLSHHDGVIEERLRQFRLENIFDDVIHLPRSVAKADYIVSRRAIFVDDSFAERQRIHAKLGIPVFDLDAIECLIDDRR